MIIAEATNKESLTIEIGDKVKFCGEKQRYTLQGKNDRYLVLTKPFNPRRTYLYTIVDLERGVRGPCDLIFGLPTDCNTPESALECLRWLEGFEGDFGRCEMEVSHRHYKELTEREKAFFQACQEGCEQ
jgi:hypothetical protein